MNSTFKVVFNKARGALMVVNVVTSSVQAKGTKTVVAAAVATMIAGVAGTAMAAEWEVAPEGLEAATDTVITDANWAAIKDQNAFELTSSDKEAKKSWASVAKDQTFDKTLWVSGAGAKAHASGFGVSGEKVKFTNKGTIYVTSGKDGVNYQNDAIWAGNGATAINEGKIVAKDAYGMRVGTGDTASKIVNNGSIYVESTGAGMELGGAANSEAVNNGLISVGEVNTESSQLPFGHGVLIQDQTGAKFTNNGTITAGKGASAIEIKKDKATTSAEINLGEKSQIDGLINIGTDTTVTLNAKGMTGKLQVKAADGTTTLNVESGSDVTLVDRLGSTYEEVNIADGKLTASIWHDTNEYGEKKEQLQNDNKFKNVTVGEKGIFNITKLNSGGSTNQTSAEAKPHTQLLIKDMELTLAGGDLQVAGKTYTDKIVIGTSNTTDTLTITAGSYKFADVNFGSGFKSKKPSKLAIAGGELTVGTLDFSNGAVTVDGKLTATKLVWEDKQYGNEEHHVSGPEGTITVNAEGVLSTVAKDNLAKKNADGTWSKTDAGSKLTNNGTLELTDKFSATAEDVKEYLSDAKTAFGGVVFKNVTLTDEELNWDAQLGMAGLNNVVTAPAPAAGADGTATIAAGSEGSTVAVAGIEVAEGTKALSITGQGKVLLRGDTASGNVFEGTEALNALEVAADLTLGYEASNKGVVNAKSVKVTGELDVVGDFTAQNVEVGSANVDGALALNSLKVAENGTAIVENGTLHLLGAAEDTAEIDGNVNVTGTGLLTTNKAAANAYIAQLDDEEPSAVLYVDRAMKLADGAQVVIGNVNVNSQQIALLTEGDAAPAATASVEVHEGGYALVDVTNFIGSEETVFGDNAEVTVENNAALDLINVAKTGEVKLGASVSVVEGGEIDTDSLYLDATPGENGTVAINYRDGVVADKTVDARLKSLFTKGASAKELAILNGLDNDAYLNTETDTFNALGNKAFEQATGGNATAGVLNVAYDANAQVTDAIVRHQLSEHAGMGVWADVFYAKNEAKKLYGDFGYSADIYGGVLGFDYTAACGGTLGAALTVGTADADSEGGALSNSLSSDFVGLSVYASKDFSGLNVKADLGYIDFSNDFTGIGDASDATTITFGVRGDFTAYQNGAFSVVPHMGLRYTRIDTDAVAFNEEQNMNVLEAPIGVKFAGTFEATGWKLVPSYDFTIVPQLGDKEVEAFGTAGDITILSGGLFNNVLGVEAVKDNMSFGLNASYGFGPDDRANTQVNANFRYNF